MALVAKYRLRSNLNDFVGSNNGTDANANVTYTASGPVSAAAVLSSSRVTASATAITGNWTMGFWAYRTGSANNNGSVYEVGTVGGSGFGVMVWGTGGSGIPDGGIDWWVNGLHQTAADYIATNITLPLNSWTRVIITYDGTNVTSYQDGVQKSQIAFTTNPSSATTLCIGDRNGAAGNYYNGRLCEAFTDNAAVTAAWVKNDYAFYTGNI